MANKIRYGQRPFYRKMLSRIMHQLTTPSRLLGSYTEREEKIDVGCVMCVWNEADNVELAIESSKDFVSKYIIIDKNGETIPTIRKIEEKYQLNVEYHIKPDMNLIESRRYGVERVKETWILILDGDEVLLPNMLLEKMKYKNTYIRTCKNIIYPKQQTELINNGYHSILLHNNGTVYVPKKFETPRMKGRAIYLKKPCMFNLHFTKDRGKKLIPYNEEIQGKIPEIIKNMNKVEEN